MGQFGITAGTFEDETQAKLSELERRIQNQSTVIDQVEADVVGMDQDLITQRAQLATLEADVANLEVDVTSYKGRTNQLSDKIYALEDVADILGDQTDILLAKVLKLEEAVFPTTPPPPPPPPPEPPPPPPPPTGRESAWYQMLVAKEGIEGCEVIQAASLLSQEQINGFSTGGVNAAVHYPPHVPVGGEPAIDAAQMTIKGDDHPDVIADPSLFENGNDISTNLWIPIPFAPPDGKSRYLLVWDTMYSQGMGEQIHSPDNPWSGMKTGIRLTGLADLDRDRVSVMKTDLTFRLQGGYPDLGHNWSKIDSKIPVGPNVSRREPLLPSNWNAFHPHAGVPFRTYLLMEEGETWDTWTCWVADANRAPVMTIDHLQFRRPVEMALAEIRISPKAARTKGPTYYVYWREVVCLRDFPGPIEDYLVQPPSE